MKWLVINLLKIVLLGMVLFGALFDEQLDGLAPVKRPVSA